MRRLALSRDENVNDPKGSVAYMAERILLMSTVITIITVLLLVVAALLVVTVLMQKSKSGGAGSAFGSDTQSFTSRGKAASKEAKLQKLTVIFAIVLGVLAIVLAILS